MGFNQVGIKVYYDGESKTVEESVNKFLQNKLQEMTPEMSCSHHRF